LSNQLSYFEGVLLFGLWGVYLGYQFVHSEAFIEWAWKERRLPQMTIYVIAAIVGMAAGLALVRLYELQHSKLEDSPSKEALPNIADKIYVAERNAFLWDHTGDPNKGILLTKDTIIRTKAKGQTTEVYLTPIVGNAAPGEVLASGTRFTVTINFGSHQGVSFGQHRIWRPMHSVLSEGYQSFTATISEPVPAGSTFLGPDEMITAKLPVGKYKVDYVIGGRTEKHEPFEVKGHYWIEIYPDVANSDITLSGVKWDFQNFVGTVSRGEELFAFVFTADGHNLTGKPITNISGFLRSNITNEIYAPLYIVIDGKPVLPEQTHGIPVDASFTIDIPFAGITGEFDKMMKESEFLKKLVDFTFVVDIEGARSEYRFERQQVINFLEQKKRSLYPPQKPKVTQKS
jgi:hypothetical protein